MKKLLLPIFLIVFLLASISGWCLGNSSNSEIPAGTIWMYAGSTAPDGWALCDGSTYASATYPELTAAIGTCYGGGTTWKLPDFRGVFPKGLGQNATLGANYANASGTPTGDKFQGHWHDVVDGYNTSWGINRASYSITGSQYGWYSNGGPGSSYSPVAAGIITGSNGAPRTGDITEPANVGINFIIKLY